MKENSYLKQLREKTGYYDYYRNFNTLKDEELNNMWNCFFDKIPEFQLKKRTAQDCLMDSINCNSIISEEIKKIIKDKTSYQVDDILVGDLLNIGFDCLALLSPNQEKLIIMDLRLYSTLGALLLRLKPS